MKPTKTKKKSVNVSDKLKRCGDVSDCATRKKKGGSEWKGEKRGTKQAPRYATQSRELNTKNVPIEPHMYTARFSAPVNSNRVRRGSRLSCNESDMSALGSFQTDNKHLVLVSSVESQLPCAPQRSREAQEQRKHCRRCTYSQHKQPQRCVAGRLPRCHQHQQFSQSKTRAHDQHKRERWCNALIALEFVEGHRR